MEGSGPGLLAVARDRMRTRHLAYRTEQAYLQWIRRYLRFHDRRHPRELGAEGVERFLSHLATHRKVSPSTQNQALQALLFLYRNVLGVELPWLDNVTRATRPRRLPVVLSRDEVRAVLARLPGTAGLVARLLYGSGLRVSEALRLRVKDLALDRRALVVRDGKGGKDRVTVLPEAVLPELRAHLGRLREWYGEERRRGGPGVSLPAGLGRKYPRAATEWGSTCSPRRGPAATRTPAARCGTTCTRACCSGRCGRRRCRPASRSPRPRTPSATASPPTCSRTAATSARFRNCSATAT
jgi:integron integrase